MLNTKKGLCYLCGAQTLTQAHHVFNGPYRKKSDRMKLIVNLCLECHTGNNGVHRNATKMHKLKADIQEKVMEEMNWSTEDFIREFGKNYL